MSLDVLKRAVRLAAPDPVPGLPPNILRITLEYPAPPDIAAERAELAALLEGPNFDLQPLDPLLPEFLVLQFSGIERRIAPDTLYAAADALVDPLGLVSAVPDVGVTYVAAPEDPARPEGVDDLFLSVTCWVPEDTSVDRDWAVKSIRAPQAWAKSRGAGVLVVQPDTGVARHQELNQALDVTKAFNVLDGTADPSDPLQSAMQNPGHGTSTASVVASRAAGGVFGSAPGAKVAPVRCVNSVVLGLDPTPVAKAILHAVSVDADVISMSLGGGFHSPVVAKALRRAAEAGIIAVAAGGNCVQPLVVYPASDPNCIAMGGVNRLDQPWKGTSRGRRIDVSAPAENVYVAVRRPDDGGATNRIKPSQGTSFAAALTAGVAALLGRAFRARGDPRRGHAPRRDGERPLPRRAEGDGATARDRDLGLAEVRRRDRRRRPPPVAAAGRHPRRRGARERARGADGRRPRGGDGPGPRRDRAGRRRLEPRRGRGDLPAQRRLDAREPRGRGADGELGQAPPQPRDAGADAGGGGRGPRRRRLPRPARDGAADGRPRPGADLCTQARGHRRPGRRVRAPRSARPRRASGSRAPARIDFSPAPPRS